MVDTLLYEQNLAQPLQILICHLYKNSWKFPKVQGQFLGFQGCKNFRLISDFSSSQGQ